MVSHGPLDIVPSLQRNFLTYILHFFTFSAISQPFTCFIILLSSIITILSLPVCWFFVFWLLVTVPLEHSWFTIFACLFFSICGLTVTLFWSHISGVVFITVSIWSCWWKVNLLLSSSLYLILLEYWGALWIWLLFTWFDNVTSSLLRKSKISSLK